MRTSKSSTEKWGATGRTSASSAVAEAHPICVLCKLHRHTQGIAVPFRATVGVLVSGHTEGQGGWDQSPPASHIPRAKQQASPPSTQGSSQGASSKLGMSLV